MESQHPTLTPADLQRFGRDGYVVVRQAFPPADALAMEGRWWAELAETHGIRRDDRSSWRPVTGNLKSAKRDPGQRAMLTETVAGVFDDLLGAGSWSPPRNWGVTLATFPEPGDWELPARLWHWDNPVEPHLDRMRGLFVVSFIGQVAPRGGGTLILSGSPRLVIKQARRLSADQRRALGSKPWELFGRSHPWLSALTGQAPSPADRLAAFMAEETVVDGVALRVVELTGGPGDMVFCHPVMVHCAAPNRGEWPRFMRIRQQFLTSEGCELVLAACPEEARRHWLPASRPWQNRRVRIGMLGPLEVWSDDGVPAGVPGARLRGLLAAFAQKPGQVIQKTALIDWIWGEQPPADATNALQRLVSRLRKALPDVVIDGQQEGYVLRVEPDAVDAVRFERLVIAGRAKAGDGSRQVRLLREALDLWRGAAMQDVGLLDSGAFDAAVVRLEELRLAATEEWADAEVGRGRGADVVTELTGLVAAHPMRERLVAALMRALAAAGRDNEALLVYQRTRETLASELGTDPSPGLSAVHVALLRGELGHREETRKTNLHAELTSFVGKDADIAAVRELIATRRLTTLIGPGGSGKTRLAAETARTLLDDLPDGAWLVELAAIGADGDVAQTTLTALGLRDAQFAEAPGTDLTGRLIAAIRQSEALLILDNCEHVIGPAARFAHRVLGECRRLRILATSREPLGITGETLWLVEPLALPEANAGPVEIEASPAVRLLRDRASAVRKDLIADERALTTMARVCRALDGLPLAIELAAARLHTMSVDQLASRLDDRFRLLTSGSRTALPRHQTLRAVVDWSWTLLTDAERTVLRRLSVFSGGASLEAAERVCGAGSFSPGCVAPEEVLYLLSALTEKSLLRAEYDSAPRYRMNGTIREYAGQRLAEAGETELARHAHLAYFTELAETAEPHLRRAEQLEWLSVLEADHGNIGAAMRGALAAGEAQAAMRLAAGAGWYWWLGGHKAEGMDLLTAAANTQGEVTDDIRALVYALLVHFASGGRGGEHEIEKWINQAYRYSQRSQRRHPSLEIVGALQRMLRAPDAFLTAFEPLLDAADPWVRALARLHVGKSRIVLGLGGQDGLDADAYLAQALAEFRALGDRFGIWFALIELADRVAVRGELAVACEYYEQAVAVLIETGAVEDVIQIRSRQAQLYWLLGDKDSTAAAVAEAHRYADRVNWPDALAELALALAELARWDGDAAEARRQLGRAAAVLGDAAEQPHVRAITQDLLGYLAADLGEARAHHAAACAAATEAGYPPLTAKVLVGVADLALRRGQDEQAARLLAASDAVRGLPDRSQPDEARVERTARSRLGDARFAEASLQGTGMSWSALAEVTLAS